MKPARALSATFCFGLLTVGMLIAPAKMTAASTTSPIVGTWEGKLDPGAQPKKRVVVHVSVGQDGIISGTIDYPDQDTSGIAITAITYKERILHFESSSSLVSFDGAMNEERSEISGTWTQTGTKLNLVLKRTQ